MQPFKHWEVMLATIDGKVDNPFPIQRSVVVDIIIQVMISTPNGC